MTLQHKAWALILISIGFLVSMAVLVSGRTIHNSFSELEQNRATLEIERAMRLLGQQMAGLSAFGSDYAYWTDTVEYVNGQNPGYLTENFTVENMNSLRVAKVLVLDRNGSPVGSIALVDGDRLLPLANDTSLLLQRLAVPVLKDPTSATVVKTYQAVGGQLYLVSIAAVRAQNAPGSPPHGALAVVRHFDKAELKQFSEVLMAPVRLSFLDVGHAGAATFLDVVNDHQAEAHALIRNNEDRAVAELVLGLDRKLYQEGQSLIWAAGAQVAVAGLLLGGVLLLLLNRLVLHRVKRMHHDLHAMTEEELASGGQMHVDGKDELADLSSGLNRLLQRVRLGMVAQQAAHAKQDALQLQLMQSQKTEALGRFTGGIAHDFNNSLAAITGWMRLAVEDLDKEHPSHEALQHALKATRYADGLMRQLLAYSRQSAPRLERVSLETLVDDSRSLLSSGMKQRSALDVQCLTEHAWVHADPTQMQQVLINLLINASDAMQGEGTIRLAIDELHLPSGEAEDALLETVALPPGRYISIKVKDDGSGIAPEHLSQVFDPFFTTKSVGKGTGLGLSVAYGIVARHGGVIAVGSKLGEGACFRILLPALNEALEDAGIAADPLPVSTRQILFADDDQLVRHALSAFLERRGWQVTRARNGEEAWRLYQQNAGGWALVLTDLTMPELDGRGLAHRIRGTQAPPQVVLMSGNVSADEAGQMVQTDFAAVLNKPVDLDELERVLQRLARAPADSVHG